MTIDGLKQTDFWLTIIYDFIEPIHLWNTIKKLLHFRAFVTCICKVCNKILWNERFITLPEEKFTRAFCICETQYCADGLSLAAAVGFESCPTCQEIQKREDCLSTPVAKIYTKETKKNFKKTKNPPQSLFKPVVFSLSLTSDISSSTRWSSIANISL